MSHLVRKDLQRNLKHSALYIARIVMQTISNLWEVGKAQQLIVTGLLLVISIFISIAFGVVNTFNIASGLTVLGVMLLLILVVSFLRAPFQLDREQLEENELLKQENDKLKIKLTPLLEKPELEKSDLTHSPTRQTATALLEQPKETEKPKIEILYEDKSNYRIYTENFKVGIKQHHQKVRIGVKSKQTISNLRVEAEIEGQSAEGKKLIKIPLRESYDAVPYKREFTLLPEHEMFFDIIGHSTNESIAELYTAAPETTPTKLNFSLPEGGRISYKVTITVYGKDALPASIVLVMSIGKGGFLWVNRDRL